MCLCTIMHNHNPFDSPSELKEYLGVKRNEPIDIGLIPKLEQKMPKFKINVKGDFIYTSLKECPFEINLTLRNGHYTVDRSKDVGSKFLKTNNYKKKNPLIFHMEEEGLMSVFDGQKNFLMKHEHFKKDSKNKNSQFVYVKKDKKKTNEETFRYFCELADALKKETNGIINMYKTGSNYKTALNLFDRFSKFVKPEEIQQDEADFIMNSSLGPLIYSEPYEGPAHKYDITSMYPPSCRVLTF